MFPLPLEIVVGASVRLQRIHVAAHVTAVSALLLTAMPDIMQLGGIALLGMSLIRQLRTRPPLRLRAGLDNKLQVRLGDTWQEVRLSGSSVVWPGAISLDFAQVDQHRSQHFLILPDSMPSADFRRFRVWLRWRGSRGATGMTKAAQQINNGS